MSKEADELRNEAKILLHRAFRTPYEQPNDSIDRIVDCIIGATIIDVASLNGQGLQILNKVYK